MIKKLFIIILCIFLLGNQTIFALDTIESLNDNDNIISSNEMNTDGIPLWCTLFGHDFNQILYNGVHYLHGISETPPYCQYVYYHHYVCSREGCPASKDEIYKVEYYNCHP
jgi:hypothetical protein